MINGTNNEYDIFHEIADEVFGTRKAIRMTQVELEEKSGVTNQTISHIENGSSNPSIKVLQLIADGLGKRLSVKFVDFEGGNEV